MPVTLPEIVRHLSSLPAERVAEVYDFILFLKTRPAAAVDESDEWSNQDQHDVTAASRNYAEGVLAAEEGHDD